jgi:hypothetical protein
MLRSAAGVGRDADDEKGVRSAPSTPRRAGPAHGERADRHTEAAQATGTRQGEPGNTVSLLAGLFTPAGFRDVRVQRETREGIIESFDDYWSPIETGTGQLPQAYRALPESTRRAVREAVHARLAPFDSNGRLVMRVEMLIGAGRA